MKAKKRVVKKQVKVLIPRKYVEAVERGVQFLDLLLGRKVWLKRIDLKKFDISGLGDGSGDVVTRLGFYTPTDKGFQYLQDLWVMKIKQLKARTR